MNINFTSLGKTIISTIHNWIESNRELFINAHYPHSGHSGFHYFINSTQQFELMVENFQKEAIFTIWRDSQFPHCGIVNNEFIQTSLTEYKKGQWYLIIKPGIFYPEESSWVSAGNTVDELKQDLEENKGTRVCVGPDIDYPNYWEENTRSDVIITSKADLVQIES